jgi:TonB family protein
MPPRRLLLALACALALPLGRAGAQDSAAAKPFLTGVCSPDAFIDPDSVVAEPEQAPTLPRGFMMPRYPESLHRPGYQGTVSAAFIVGADGVVRPGSVAVMTSTDSVLSRWACDAVPTIRFVPARHHGRTVMTQVVMPFTYRVAGDVPRPVTPAPASPSSPP